MMKTDETVPAGTAESIPHAKGAGMLAAAPGEGQGWQAEPGAHAPAADHGAEAGLFPASFAQRRLWFLDQVNPGNTLYNVPSGYRIHGRLDAGVLERAFGAVIARHEVLRTTFRPVAGEPMQAVAMGSNFRLALADLRAMPEAEREAEVKRLLEAESGHSFDLAAGPLLRATLAELGPQEQALIMNLHHIVTDSWSHEVLMRELTFAYSELARGAAPALPELPIQYADFAAWQRETMQGEALEKELAYWRGRLEGIAPVELPRVCDAAGAEEASGEHRFTVPESTAAAVRAMAQREGCSFFMALLTGWKCLLARYTGQADIAVGSPISDRNRSETEGLIGFFLNTLVLRTALTDNPSAREALKRVRETVLEAFAHQELPFERIVEELHPARQAGRNPLLRVMFVFLTGDEKTWPTRDGELVPMEADEFNAKFDMVLHLRDRGGAVEAALVYGAGVCNAATAKRLGACFQCLMAGMAADPERKLETLPLMEPAERGRILREWSGTSTPYPADRTVQSLFMDQARREPAAVAVEDGTTAVTYGELDRQADAVAGCLRRNGVKAGEVVAIQLPRSAGLIAGILGILKAGGTYLPLDPALPAERVEMMLREAGAAVFIGGEAALAGMAIRRVGIAECLAAEPGGLEGAEPAPDSPAYVMFTSGSTGVPKGVRVTHRGITRLVMQTNYVRFTAADVVAHGSNPAFDASTFEIWGALLNGGRLVIVPRETLLSPQELGEFVTAKGISILFLTTPLFHQIARSIPAGFARLRYLVAGGDALQPEAARAFLEAARPARLINGYGPTEVTTFAVCHEAGSVPPGATRVPIGRPISNTRAYILDAALEPVPEGIPGELCLGGPGVAAGYVNDPAGTAAKFLPDPFSNEPGARLYRTGDRARWNTDGTIDFLGRSDDQVKIRGFRIEPGEIEAAMRQGCGLAECKVIARTLNAGEKCLVAYYTRPAQQANGSGTPREELARRLPEYMIPAAFVEVPRMPLNANGKIAVDQLPAPDFAAEPDGTQAESLNTLHSQLMEVWQETLGRRPTGIRDDFFEIGGHSLLAVRMLAMVEERLGVRAPLSVLFENATIEHLAASLIHERQAAASAQPFVAIHPEGRNTPFFFLHGDFVGGGFFCRGLAHEIGPDRPFYAIHPHGLLGDAPPRSISVMAAERLPILRRLQGHGPYLLGGYCNGALVAFEMARMLEAEGESVPAVLIFMATGSAYRHRLCRRLSGIVSALAGDERLQRDQRFLNWRRQIAWTVASARHYAAAARKLVGQPLTEQSRRLSAKVTRVMRRSSRATGRMRDEIPPGVGTEDYFWQLYRDASESYVPRHFGGQLVLLWPNEQQIATGEDPAYGWESVSDKFELVYVPGDHDTAITQSANLAAVGREMRRALDAACPPGVTTGAAEP